MKSKIKNLLELLRELIPENNQERYNDMRLIPVPVRPRQERPNPYNPNR